MTEKKTYLLCIVVEASQLSGSPGNYIVWDGKSTGRQMTAAEFERVALGVDENQRPGLVIDAFIMGQLCIGKTTGMEVANFGRPLSPAERAMIWKEKDDNDRN